MSIYISDLRNTRRAVAETGRFEPALNSSRGAGLYSEVYWHSVGSQRPAEERSRLDGDRPGTRP